MLRDMLEQAGRLTSGDAPLNERRKGLTHQLRDTHHMLCTSIANWPKEYQLAPDHPLFELLEVMIIVCDDMEAPINEPDNSRGP